jgi:MFS family permease
VTAEVTSTAAGGHAVLRNRRALALLGCLSLQRLAVAALPVVLVVAAADLRGYAAAASIQGLRVVTNTASAPFRARLLDRVGRDRVIVPQTVLAAVLLLLLATTLTATSVPLPLVLAVTVASSLASPSMDAVIRTVWRTLGANDQQVEALHSYDSILEELGYLAGPAGASVLILALGQRPAVFTVIVALAAGWALALSSGQVRSALRPRPTAGATGSPSPAGPTRPPNRLTRALRTLAGPIAIRELRRIVAPLILMGTVFGIVGILAPALAAEQGHIGAAGFILAAISLGGVIGALAYSTVRIAAPLRIRQAALGVLFGAPLTAAFLGDGPWILAVLLAVAGLAVTPLYINSYLMMDAEIPDSSIHEANTWVPVGNNVGYVIGITVAAALLDRTTPSAALAAISVVAAVLVVHSAAQLLSARRIAAVRPGRARPDTT